MGFFEWLLDILKIKEACNHRWQCIGIERTPFHRDSNQYAVLWCPQCQKEITVDADVWEEKRRNEIELSNAAAQITTAFKAMGMNVEEETECGHTMEFQQVFLEYEFNHDPPAMKTIHKRIDKCNTCDHKEYTVIDESDYIYLIRNSEEEKARQFFENSPAAKMRRKYSEVRREVEKLYDEGKIVSGEPRGFAVSDYLESIGYGWAEKQDELLEDRIKRNAVMATERNKRRVLGDMRRNEAENGMGDHVAQGIARVEEQERKKREERKANQVAWFDFLQVIEGKGANEVAQKFYQGTPVVRRSGMPISGSNDMVHICEQDRAFDDYGVPNPYRHATPLEIEYQVLREALKQCVEYGDDKIGKIANDALDRDWSMAIHEKAIGNMARLPMQVIPDEVVVDFPAKVEPTAQTVNNFLLENKGRIAHCNISESLNRLELIVQLRDRKGE